MENISRFRLVAAIYLFLEIFGYIIYESVNSSLPQYLKNHEENGYSYISEDYKGVFYVVLLIFILAHITSILLLMMKKWSVKYIYAISGVSLYLISPVYGPVVEHGFTSMLSSIASIFFGMSVMYSFWLSEKVR